MSRRVTRALVAGGVALPLAIGLPGAALAGGGGTYRGAANESELASAITNSADGDTIVVQADITLTTALPAITQGVRVRGNGFTVSGAGATRVLDVAATGPGHDVTITDLTLANGTAATGAGIRVRAGASAYLRDATLIGNAADSCGAFDARGTLVLSRVSVVGNRATTGAGGAGCTTAAGDLLVSNSALADNTAAGMGGAIASIDGGRLTSLNSSFTGNASYDLVGTGTPRGGAIGIRSSSVPATVALINSLMAYNATRITDGYVLDDVAADGVDPRVVSRSSMFGGAVPVMLDVDDADVAYPAALDGAPDTLFGQGTTSAVTDAQGVPQGTGQVYRPALTRFPGGRLAPAPMLDGFATGIAALGTSTRFALATDGPVVAAWSRSADPPEWLAIAPFGVGAGADLVTTDIRYATRPDGSTGGQYTVRGAVQPQPPIPAPGEPVVPPGVVLTPARGLDLAIVTSREKMFTGDDVTVEVRVRNGSASTTARAVNACITIPRGFRIAARRTATVNQWPQACFRYPPIAPSSTAARSILLKAVTGARVTRSVAGSATGMGVYPAMRSASSRSVRVLGMPGG